VTIINRKTVKEILTLMSTTTEKELIIEYENVLSYMIAVPFLLFGAFINMMLYFAFQSPFIPTALNSSFVLLIALLFWATSKFFKEESFKANIYTCLFVAVFVFIVVRFYPIIGPSLWSLSLVLIMIAMLHVKRTMLVVMSITLMVTGFYVAFKALPYEMNGFYYLTQIISFTIMLIIASSVHDIIGRRFAMILNQFHRLYNSEGKLNLTLKSVGDGVITVDQEGTIEFMNPIAEDLTGWTQAEAQGKMFNDVFRIINEQTREYLNSPIEQVFKDKEIVALADNTILVSKDGREIPINDTSSPIRNPAGKVIGAVIVFRDYTKKSQEHKEIVYLSYHDQLTGLFNRRFFEEELSRLDTRRNYPFSIIFADVNGLKTINDAFGHGHGDELIKTIASIIKTESRADDIVARTGGDEFIILLPKTHTVDAQKTIRRYKEKIERHKIMNIGLSVSFGHAIKTDGTQSIFTVLKNAEDDMYQKKILYSSSKRNGVIKSIINMLHIKSPRENAHSSRVSILCESLGHAYDFSDDDIQELKIAGELHDIGKIAIDEVVLNKSEALTHTEYAQIQHHPETGFRLLGTSKEYFNIAEYVLAHHERWDGKGYPKGLKGDKIPFKARMIAIADSYDAMTSIRPYNKAMSTEEAVEEIKKCAGKQFDPEVAIVFVREVLSLS